MEEAGRSGYGALGAAIELEHKRAAARMRKPRKRLLRAARSLAERLPLRRRRRRLPLLRQRLRRRLLRRADLVDHLARELDRFAALHLRGRVAK